MRTAVFYVPNEIQPADGLWQSIAEISSLYCNDDAAERDLRRQAYPAAAAQSRAEQSRAEWISVVRSGQLFSHS